MKLWSRIQGIEAIYPNTDYRYGYENVIEGFGNAILNILIT
jgi:hypothetical protein